jgi:hypothetical protein
MNRGTPEDGSPSDDTWPLVVITVAAVVLGVVIGLIVWWRWR